MKNIITLLLLLSAAYTLKAQVYVPFPTANATWTERHGQGDTTPQYYCYGLKTEDTVIKSITYHKLYQSADTIFSASEYYGGLRENARKIYFYDHGMNAERLLYDFTMAVGDTLHPFHGPEGIVSHIDSINISGTYHRRINFKTMTGHPWGLGSWVEGIGNIALGGLLRSPMAQPTCDCANNLICFKNAGTWRYHNPNYKDIDCLPDPVGVKEIMVKSADHMVYPNPLVSIARIYTGGSYNKMTVYNINGAKVMSYDIAPGQDEILLDKKDYATGMYCYLLSDNSGRTGTGKFMVQ